MVAFENVYLNTLLLLCYYNMFIFIDVNVNVNHQSCMCVEFIWVVSFHNKKRMETNKSIGVVGSEIVLCL